MARMLGRIALGFDYDLGSERDTKTAKLRERRAFRREIDAYLEDLESNPFQLPPARGPGLLCVWRHMPVKRFRKKPVEIEAIRFTGGNTVEVCTFMADGGGGYRTTTHPTDASQDEIFIRTLEGEMRAVDGDWIVKGVVSEFYPVKPDIFEATYEPAEHQ